MTFRGYILIGLVLTIVALTGALSFSVRQSHNRAEEIETLKISLASQVAIVKARDATLAGLRSTDDDQAARAVEVCATTGNDSYLRGVQVGRAICAAR